MVTVTSYRIYCTECDNEEVIREDNFEDSPWKIIAPHYYKGLCPRCNKAVDLSKVENGAQYEESLRLEDLDNIGTKAAQNLREAGYDSSESVAKASDDELLGVSWVGEKALLSLKEAAKELEPQKRWE